MGAESLRAYRYGRYDPAQYAQAQREVAAERGCPVLLPYSVNLRLVGHGDFDGEQTLAARRQLDEYAELRAHELRALVAATEWQEELTETDYPLDNLRFSVWAMAEIAEMTLIGYTRDNEEDDIARVVEWIAFEERVGS